MIKAYEKIIWRIELGAIYLLGPKGSLLVKLNTFVNFIRKFEFNVI